MVVFEGLGVAHLAFSYTMSCDKIIPSKDQAKTKVMFKLKQIPEGL